VLLLEFFAFEQAEISRIDCATIYTLFQGLLVFASQTNTRLFVTKVWLDKSTFIVSDLIGFKFDLWLLWGLFIISIWNRESQLLIIVFLSFSKIISALQPFFLIIKSCLSSQRWNEILIVIVHNLIHCISIFFQFKKRIFFGADSQSEDNV